MQPVLPPIATPGHFPGTKSLAKHWKRIVIDKNTLEVIKTLTVPDQYPGRAVHMEYNKAGDEVWVAVWGTKEQPTALLVYDDKTLELKHEITGDWVRTPTGHFNVFNTTNDVY